MKWDYCNTDKDDKISVAERNACDMAYAKLWHFEAEAKEIEKRLEDEPVFQALSAQYPPEPLSFPQFRGHVMFQVAAEVQGLVI